MKILSLNLLSLFLVLQLYAQVSVNQVFFNETTPVSFSVKYNAALTNDPTNVILQKLKNGSNTNKPLNLMEWVINAQVVKKLTLRTGNQFEINVLMNSLTITGEDKYRGFDVKDKVMPSLGSVKIELRPKTGRSTTALYSKIVNRSEIQLPLVLQENYAYLKDSLALTEYKILVDEINVSHSAEQTTAFLAQADKIDQYFNDSQILPAMLSQTMAIQSTNIDILPGEDQKLIAVEQKLGNIVALNYIDQLGLKQYDPANFVAQVNQCMALATQKRNEINSTKANAHIIMHQRGMALLQQNQKAGAKKMFENALVINPQFAPSMLPLAQLEIQENNPEKAAQLARGAKQFSMNDNSIIKDAQAVFSDIINYYLSISDKAMQNKNANQALDAVNAAKVLCQGENLNCEPTLSNKVKSIKTTVFENQMREAMAQPTLEAQRTGLENTLGYAKNNPEVDAQSVDKGKFELKNTINKIFDKKVRDGAQGSLDNQRVKTEEAIAFGQSNPDVEGTGMSTAQNQLKSIVGQLFGQKVSQVESNTQNNNFTQAEASYAEAVKLQQQYPDKITDLSILQNKYAQLKQKQYNTYVSEGQALVNQKNGVAALEKFKQALTIQGQYLVTANPQVENYQHQAALLAISNRYDYGLLMVKQNNLSEARTALSTMKELQNQYNLGGDNTANKQVQELGNKLFSQVCVNGQNEVDALYNLGKTEEQGGRYIEANNQYEKALAKSRDYSDCQLNFNKVNESKNKIQTAVTYQSNMQNIETLYKNAQFSELIGKYVSATSQWQADNVKTTFGLNHSTLLEYTNSKGNPDMMLTVGNYLLDQQNPDFVASMNLLKSALNKQVNVKSTDALQNRLGVFYAKNDYKNNAAVDGKSQLVQHTGNDKRLKTFTKSYTTALKGLQKK